MGMFRENWEQIRGNLKYDLIKYTFVFAGAVVMAASAYLASLLKNLPTWFLPSAVLAVALIAFWWLGRTLNGRKAIQADEEPQEPLSFQPAGQLPAPSLASPEPKPVDLRGEILELYFDRQCTPGISLQVSILMKIRITNHGPDQAAITGWTLHFQLGEEIPRAAEVIDIPSVWWIKKWRADLFNREPIKEKIDVRLNELPTTSTYQKGVPQTGWIAFEYFTGEDIEFPNARFIVHAQDSFGNRHTFQRPAGIYRRLGQLMTSETDFIEMRLPKT